MNINKATRKRNSRLEAQLEALKKKAAELEKEDGEIQAQIAAISEDVDAPIFIKNRSWKYKRTEYKPLFNDEPLLEKIFADEWEKECQPKSWLNFGFGLAQDLFMTYPEGKHLWHTHAYAVTVINGRDRMIMATVVQWLGTNTGFCFLSECLNKAGYAITKLPRK